MTSVEHTTTTTAPGNNLTLLQPDTDMPYELLNLNLFKPIQLNEKVKLNHRVVLPPLTRFRAADNDVPSDLMLQYYEERSREPGTLLTTEAVFISEKAGGYKNVPGIWNETQVQAWKKITDAVHANGSYISIQLWNLGRQANVVQLTKLGHLFKAPTAGLYMDKRSKQKAEQYNNPLTALTREEIKQYVKQYGVVAQNCVRAGFDFIELHGANGYLFDQFIQEVTNKRTDEYGGSIENRARFLLEAVDEIIKVLGDSSKLAVRLSPWATYAGMPGYKAPINPIATFAYIISELQRRATAHGQFGYLSIIEPRVSRSILVDTGNDSAPGNNEWVFDVWKGTVIRSGNYVKEIDALIQDVNKNNRTLIAVGRQFIANPDLVYRLKNRLHLNPYDRKSFYYSNDYGYNTYPTYHETTRQPKGQALKKFPVALVQKAKL